MRSWAFRLHTELKRHVSGNWEIHVPNDLPLPQLKLLTFDLKLGRCCGKSLIFRGSVSSTFSPALVAASRKDRIINAVSPWSDRKLETCEACCACQHLFCMFAIFICFFAGINLYYTHMFMIFAMEWQIYWICTCRLGGKYVSSKHEVRWLSLENWLPPVFLSIFHVIPKYIDGIGQIPIHLMIYFSIYFGMTII